MAGRGAAWGRVVLATLTIAPPVIVGYSRWSWITKHGLWTAIAVAGYEALVVTVGFIGQVWGQLRVKWAGRLSERIDQAAGRRFSRFEQHYRNYVQQTH